MSELEEAAAEAGGADADLTRVFIRWLNCRREALCDPVS